MKHTKLLIRINFLSDIQKPRGYRNEIGNKRRDTALEDDRVSSDCEFRSNMRFVCLRNNWHRFGKNNYIILFKYIIYKYIKVRQGSSWRSIPHGVWRRTNKKRSAWRLYQLRELYPQNIRIIREFKYLGRQTKSSSTKNGKNQERKIGGLNLVLQRKQVKNKTEVFSTLQKVSSCTHLKSLYIQSP